MWWQESHLPHALPEPQACAVAQPDAQGAGVPQPVLQALPTCRPAGATGAGSSARAVAAHMPSSAARVVIHAFIGPVLRDSPESRAAPAASCGTPRSLDRTVLRHS